MNTSATLLIDALLARLSPSQADALLDQLDKSLFQKQGDSRPRTMNGRRRSDNEPNRNIDHKEPRTSKDQPS